MLKVINCLGWEEKADSVEGAVAYITDMYYNASDHDMDSVLENTYLTGFNLKDTFEIYKGCLEEVDRDITILDNKALVKVKQQEAKKAVIKQQQEALKKIDGLTNGVFKSKVESALKKIQRGKVYQLAGTLIGPDELQLALKAGGWTQGDIEGKYNKDSWYVNIEEDVSGYTAKLQAV